MFVLNVSLFYIKSFLSETLFVCFDKFDTIRMLLTLENNTFIPRPLGIRTAATDGFARLDANLLFGLFLFIW